MDKFENLIKILKEFNLNKAIEKIIKANQKEILNLIPKEQIYKGIKGDGGAIVPPYTPAYRSYKTKRGLYQGFVDLHLSGDYLDSFTIEYTAEGFIIQSNRIENGFNLSEHLKGRYGAKVEEFTEEHFNLLLNIIREGLINEIKRQIQSI